MTDLILPATLTTELQAVNVLITSMGEEPVATLTPSPSPDVDKALGALNETMAQVQSRGWQWNTEIAFPLTPNIVAPATSGPVALPANTLEMSRAYFTPQQLSGQQPYDIVARGLALYDRYHQSYNFCDVVYVDLTLFLEWALIPQKARRVITLEAVQLFQSRDQMAEPTLQVNAKTLKDAWALIEQGQDQESRGNQIYGNLDGYTKILGEGSLRRNRLNG
jgi:hypothetical protein